jgi:hypothetical protein
VPPSFVLSGSGSAELSRRAGLLCGLFHQIEKRGDNSASSLAAHLEVSR